MLTVMGIVILTWCSIVFRIVRGWWWLYFFLLKRLDYGSAVGEGYWRVFTTEFAHILPRHSVNGQTVLFLGHRVEPFFPDTLSASSSDSINDRITSGPVVNVRWVVKVGDVTVGAVMSRQPTQFTQTSGEASRGHFVCFVCFWLCVFDCVFLVVCFCL